MELSSSDTSADTEDEFDVIRLMKQTLPAYVVNRFLAAGYDSKEVLASMDVSSKKGNSITEIEKFIERSFPDDNTMCCPFPSSKHPYEFPPGHRIRICNFVQEVKKSCRCTVSLSKKEKCIPPKNKYQKIDKHILAKSKTEENLEVNTDVDKSSIANQIHDNIAKWVRCQVDDKLKSICIDKHYSIKVCDSSHVYVACLLYNTTVKILQQKNGNYLTSNWFKHIKRCIRIKRPQQPKLNCFLSKGPTSSISLNAPSHNSFKSFNPSKADISKSLSEISSPAHQRLNTLVLQENAIAETRVEESTDLMNNENQQHSNTVFQQSPSFDEKAGTSFQDSDVLQASMEYDEQNIPNSSFSSNNDNNINVTDNLSEDLSLDTQISSKKLAEIKLSCYEGDLTNNTEIKKELKDDTGKNWSRTARAQ